MQDIENELFIIKINIYKNNKGYIAHQEGKIYFSWGGTSKQYKPINKIKNYKFYKKYFFIRIYINKSFIDFLK